MSLNLTLWKIKNFFLILYGEISVLIGPIPRLFVTGALDSFYYHAVYRKKTVYNNRYFGGLGILIKRTIKPYVKILNSSIPVRLSMDQT